MVTIPVEAQVSTEQLLQALEQLPPQEFATFVERLLALRARRLERHLRQTETALLLQINQRSDPSAMRRLSDLVAKRQNETINPDELDELIELTEEVERRDAQRLTALDALARLRRVPLADLLASLGIPPPIDI